MNIMELLDGLGDDPNTLAKFRKAADSADAEERRVEARIVKAALDNDAGRAFLKWLKSKVIRPPTMSELEARTCEELALISKQHIGQRQILFIILAALSEETDDARIE